MMSKKRFDDRSKEPKHLAFVSMEVTIKKQARRSDCEPPEGFILSNVEGWGVQVQPEAGCGQKISKCPLKTHLSLDEDQGCIWANS